MIKFRCEQCNQKLGVPEKYAGKVVRCTGCKQGAQVPALEPEELSADALEAYDVQEPEADDFNPLADLDALSGPSDGMQELAPMPAAGGNTCPKCGAAAGPQAVICIQCGNNLKGGGKVKTKVSKEKVGGGGGGFAINGRAILAFIVGGVVAGIGGFVWFVIAMFGFELGILAWGIGGLTGLTVAAIYHRYSVVAGVGATILALGGLLLGKGLMFLLVTGLSMLPDAMESFGDAMADVVLNDPQAFENMYMTHMADEKLFEPQLQAKIDAMPEFSFYDEQPFFPEMEAEANQKIAAMTDEDKKAFVDEIFAIEEDEEVSADIEDLKDLNAWSETFSMWDLLWFPLALGTAFSVGRGRDA